MTTRTMPTSTIPPFAGVHGRVHAHAVIDHDHAHGEDLHHRHRH
jgi:hypothetical protein